MYIKSFFYIEYSFSFSYYICIYIVSLHLTIEIVDLIMEYHVILKSS